MKNRRRILGILIAGVLALVGTFALVGYVNSARDEAVADEALVEVYVIDRLVPKGADADTIVASVRVEEVPSRLQQSGAITSLGDIGDRIAVSDLQPGDQLLHARLAATDVVLEEVADKVQVAVKLDAERAIGGMVERGDLVGVYLSFDPFQTDEAGGETGDDDAESSTSVQAAQAGDEAEDADDTDGAAVQRRTPNVSRLEFRNVLVTNVQTIDVPVDNSVEAGDAVQEQITSREYVVTLALSPEESERFVFATEFGHVWLSADPPTVADDGTRPITLSNVLTGVR